MNKEWEKIRNQVVGEWENKWQQIETSSRRVLFTRAKPSTMVHFIQQQYYLDLKNRTKRLPVDARFVEMGSGRGTTSLYLSALDGRDVTLVDLSPTALRLAREIFASEGANAQFVMADSANTRFGDNQFDCLYNIGLLEHFEDPTPILAESKRILKPGGLLWMVIVPPMPKWHFLVPRLLQKPWFSLIWFGERLVYMVYSPVKIRKHLRTLVKTYVDYLEMLGMKNIRCVGFSPYNQGVFQYPWAVRHLYLPLFMHIARLRRLLGDTSSMTCPLWMATCLLLLATKDKTAEEVP